MGSGSRSDLDPEGRAFAYQASDWARLVITYAGSAAFLTEGGLDPVLYPVDDQGCEDDEAVEEAAPVAAPRRGAGRGRLASAPRSAK